MTELDNQSNVLKADNGQLHGHLQHLKDDLQKMTLHYNECRKELEEKLNELDSLQLNSTIEKERSNQLIEAVQQLQDVIEVKEEELSVKDKDIQRITQELLEQQLSADTMLEVNAFDVLLDYSNRHRRSNIYPIFQFDHKANDSRDGNLASELLFQKRTERYKTI